MVSAEEEARAEFGTEGDNRIEHSICVEVLEASSDRDPIHSECDERDVQVKDASDNIVLAQEWLLV